MNENEFEHDGKVYVAVDERLGCEGCSFQTKIHGGCNFAAAIGFGPYCFKPRRQDGRNVIFVEKQP